MVLRSFSSWISALEAMHSPEGDARAWVEAIADELAPLRDAVEYNIEGDPRPDLIDLVLRTRPQQCTLVPVKPGEITSQAGWHPDTSTAEIGAIVRQLQAAGVRVSLFVDADEAPIRWAAALGADRIERRAYRGQARR